jgi:HAD superfamily hydrolase (TIGR01484 family)
MLVHDSSNSELMPSPRLVLIDIDGCLRPPLPFTLDIEVLQVLRSFNRKAMIDNTAVVSLISGRAQSDVQLLLELIDSSVPGICENGAAIVFPGVDDLIVDTLVTPDVLESLASFKNAATESLVRNRRATLRYGREWSVTLCPTDSHDLQSIRAFCIDLIIRQKYPLHCLTSARCIDVLPEGVDKGLGVTRLAEYLGLSLSEIAGIGDSAGDVPFLERVGYSACPGNADDSVKSAVAYIAKTDFAKGVIEIMGHLIDQRLRRHAP